MFQIQTKSMQILTLVILLALTSCQTQTRRRQPPRNSDLNKPVDVRPVENPELQPHVERPDFLEKEPRKLGLILGPGGALSFAQIGFLQELENQKVAVYAVAGVEWGALVAGAYALEKKAHAIEWKLLKLPSKEFENKGFFSSGKSAADVSKFDSYLTDIFGNRKFSDLEIPFTCPLIIVSKEQRMLRTRGALKTAVRSCWPSIPHFDIDNVGADQSGIAEMARFLRKEGADLIVYVDVLSKNTVMSAKSKKGRQAAALASIEKGGIVDLLVPPLIDQVVSLNISGKNIDSYKDLRSIIRMGQVKSKSDIKEMVKHYAY